MRTYTLRILVVFLALFIAYLLIAYIVLEPLGEFIHNKK